MKKSFLGIFLFLLGIGFLTACSEDKKEILDNAKMEVAFDLNISNLFVPTSETQTIGNDRLQKAYPNPEKWLNDEYIAYITIWLFDDPNKEQTYPAAIRISPDHRILTDTIMLINPGVGKHTLQKIVVSRKDSPEQVLFATIHTDSPYYSLVPTETLMPADLKLGGALTLFGKPIIPVSLLYAAHSKATDFGFAVWGVNCVKVICLDYVTNMPADGYAPGNAEMVASSDLLVFRKSGDNQEEAIEFIHEGKSWDGRAGTICFNRYQDNIHENDYYILKLFIPNKTAPQLIIADTLTLAQICDYKNSGFWSTSEENNGEEGFIHFNLCHTDLTHPGPVNPVNKGNDHAWTPTIIQSLSGLRSYGQNAKKEMR